MKVMGVSQSASDHSREEEALAALATRNAEGTACALAPSDIMDTLRQHHDRTKVVHTALHALREYVSGEGNAVAASVVVEGGGVTAAFESLRREEATPQLLARPAMGLLFVIAKSGDAAVRSQLVDHGVTAAVVLAVTRFAGDPAIHHDSTQLLHLLTSEAGPMREAVRGTAGLADALRAAQNASDAVRFMEMQSQRCNTLLNTLGFEQA